MSGNIITTTGSRPFSAAALDAGTGYDPWGSPRTIAPFCDVPVRLGILPSPPQASFPSKVKDGRLSPVENGTVAVENSDGRKEELVKPEKVRDGQGEADIVKKTSENAAVSNERIDDAVGNVSEDRVEKDSVHLDHDRRVLTDTFHQGSSVEDYSEETKAPCEKRYSFSTDNDSWRDAASQRSERINYITANKTVDTASQNDVTPTEIIPTTKHFLLGNLSMRRSADAAMYMKLQNHSDRTARTPTQAEFPARDPAADSAQNERVIHSPVGLGDSRKASLDLSFHTATPGLSPNVKETFHSQESLLRTEDSSVQKVSSTGNEGRSVTSAAGINPESESESVQPADTVVKSNEPIEEAKTSGQPSQTTDAHAQEESAEANAATSPRAVYFKTNSTYYNPAGPLSPTTGPPRVPSSPDGMPERSRSMSSSDSGLGEPKPRNIAADIFKAFRRASSGNVGGTTSSGINVKKRGIRRASTASNIATDPRRSPDAPPVPRIDPAFLMKTSRSSRPLDGQRRAVTDGAVTQENDGGKRKSFSRIGTLLRRFSSKGEDTVPTSTGTKKTNRLSSILSKQEKRRSFALIGDSSRTHTSNNESKIERPEPRPTSLISPDKRRASMPAAVPQSQDVRQTGVTALPAEAGRFGSHQYWEHQFRTSGLDFHPPDVYHNASPYGQYPQLPGRQSQYRAQLHRSSASAGGNLHMRSMSYQTRADSPGRSLSPRSPLRNATAAPSMATQHGQAGGSFSKQTRQSVPLNRANKDSHAEDSAAKGKGDNTVSRERSSSAEGSLTQRLIKQSPQVPTNGKSQDSSQSRSHSRSRSRSRSRKRDTEGLPNPLQHQQQQFTPQPTSMSTHSSLPSRRPMPVDGHG